MNVKTNFSLENGYAYHFGRPSGKFSGTTAAVSLKAALNNLISRAKFALGFNQYSRVGVTGTLIDEATGNKYEVALDDEGRSYIKG